MALWLAPAVAPGRAQEGRPAPAATTLTQRLEAADRITLSLPAHVGEVIDITIDQPPGAVEVQLFAPGIVPSCGPREEFPPDPLGLPAAQGSLRKEPSRQRLETVTEWAGEYHLHLRAKNSDGPTVVHVTIQRPRPATLEDALRAEATRAIQVGTFWSANLTESSAGIEFQRALALAQELHDLRLEGWATLGLGWAELEWPPAVPHFEAALALFQAADDRSGVVEAHRVLGMAAAHLGDLERTQSEFAAALAAAEDRGDSNLLAELELRWGRSLFDPFKRTDEAWQHLEAASRFAALGGDSHSRYRIGYWQGMLKRARFQLDSALQHFQESLPKAPTLRERARTLNEIGVVYDDLGEYQQARDSLLLGLAAFELIHMPPTSAQEFANSLVNLGNVSQRLGEIPQMLTSYERARQILPPSATSEARANLSNVLAWANAHEGRWQEAFQAANESIQLTTKLPAENAIARGFMGEVLLFQAGTDADALRLARSYLDSALSDYARQEAAQPAALARRYEYLGEADLRLRRYPEARASLKKALELNQRIGSLIDIALDHYYLAQIEREHGDLAAAEREVELALSSYQDLRARVGHNEAQASFSSARPRDVQEFHVDLLMERHLHEPTSGFDRQALSASEQARGQSLLDLVAQGRTTARDAPKQLLVEREAIRRALRGLDLERSRSLSGKGTGDSALARWQNELITRESELQRIDERIRALDPSYDALMRAEPASVAEIQALLDDDTVLLEYLLGNERSYLWVVTSNSVTAFTLSARREIEERARQFHDTLTGWSQPSASGLRQHRKALLHDYQRLAADLGNQLLGQSAKLLGNKRLAIVADGALEYIPFGALLDPSNGLPVIANHAVSRLPSASVLAVQRRLRERGGPPPERQLAIFADPAYVTLPRLAYSHHEAELIRTFGVEPTLFRVGADASREAVLASDLHDYRYVHFAVHGKIDAEFPSFSKLVLAEQDSEGRGIDGDLNLTDIYGLSLHADLVVLSACETALGKNVRGEGLLGLTRGFLYAGASRVLSTLWQVQDEATTRLMERFYRALLEEGQSPADALRTAQNEMRQEPGREFPYYWAGFVLQGEWR